ncbi:MAG: hypothetical protein UY23_C0004G0056 [Candidatus Jorgensenbacteria bacterium GW2011_GWA1_48_11]|uniref:Vitamin K epoxide reductase domain-containing protein n=1 Tax=Candidatus Jorgensenbacteria bacterium GW2011_GWA1_48_11 TaxID=1618660 RepID=A0A0G1UAC2_9BACT|nr:MAG: hypothetical protein UY23_C0004G0056 [Candidatus Jorgensenbacteria bacterium GW2011_GWA1_48_11]KKW11763.1 MAG: hypothetical protein UY51_C0005G0004 [Candidatus Jorgensenbacteria bacterium GW2011_GWB1_49_9]
MTSLALLFTLSAIGISETVYLIRKRIALQKPVCLIGENCAAVLESKYNRIFIVPNDILGLLFYIASSFIAAFLVIAVEPVTLWDILFKIMVGMGTLLSFFFTYLQWRVIRIWCFWCLMSAFTIWLMGVILLVSNLL